jgi:uncharacterized protein YabN with tetrapyrrole methylase and pyrophosphatase domain
MDFYSALNRALHVSKDAAQVGFDWEHAHEAVAKIREEATELESVLDQPDEAEAELGDLLFSVVNVARKLNVDPEKALARTCDKFERRFAFVIAELQKQGRAPQEATLEEMDDLWNLAKRIEAAPKTAG